MNCRINQYSTIHAAFAKPLTAQLSVLPMSRLPMCSLSLRPGSSLTILIYGFVNKLQWLGHPPHCYSSYRGLIIARVGLLSYRDTQPLLDTQRFRLEGEWL